ncbi:hypothetical protein D3C71_1187360 [compost metagenome]
MRIHPLLVFKRPASVVQQFAGFEQVIPVVAIAFRRRWLKDAGKDFWRNLRFEWCKQGQFGGVGITPRCVLSVLEITIGAAVSPVKQRFVHPFKVKGQGDCLTHTSVGKHRTLDVERQPAGVLRGFVFLLIFHDEVVSKVLAHVAGRPVFSADFLAHIVRSGFERFEGDVVVQIVVVANGIEIPAPTVDR